MAEDLSINSATGAVKLKYYSTKVDTDADADSAGYLDFDGYLKLMVAQMSNQDFNDPMSDSEFIQQMASYSMMEAIAQMNEQSQISYASSLVGKAVTVNDGSTVETGIVESVIIGDGKYQLLINGTKYDSDKVTDIVDPDTYKTLSKLIGMNGTVKDKDLGEYTDKITNIIVKNGEGFAVINNRLYAFSEITLSAGSDESSDDSSSESSGEVTDGENNTADNSTDNTVTNDPSAQAEAAAESGAVQSAQVSASGASMFLGEDGYDTTAIDEYAQQKLDEYYGSVQDDEEDIEEYPDDEEEESFADTISSYMSPMERASAAQRSAVLTDDGFYATQVEDAASSFSGVNNHSDEEGVTVRASTAMSNSDEGESEITIDEDDAAVMAEYGIAEPVANAESGKVSTYMTSSLNTDRKASDFTEDPGVSVGITVGSNSAYDQWPPVKRAFQDQYPAEAALANEYGTKMCDIRFIHNTDINSVINTDTILGSTVSGKYFTDLGYSGKGRLGEVVTWADGTQRVEIINSKGSTWYTTSGRFTLDEICDFSTDFSIGGELTIFEKVIRAAAREYTAEEQAMLDSYNTAWAQHAYYNSATLLADDSDDDE